MTEQDRAVEMLLMESFQNLGDIPRPQWMSDGSFQFEIPDIDSAVALAAHLKDAGRYSCFRGQRDADWRPRSTYARLGPKERQAANAAFNSFRNWVRRSPELVPYLTEDDQIIAAAQHHEVCETTFLDLTRDPAVAGWFATEGAKAGDLGALYLVDPERLQPVFDAFSSDQVILRFIEIDVPNLWRLQAQSGLFLECTMDLDQIWPLDRIVFRQDGTPGRIERGRIYPTDRSHLKQMIDQHRGLRRRQDAMWELLAGGNLVAIEIEDPPDTVPPKFGVLTRPADWAAGPDERWANIDSGPSSDRLAPSDLREEDAALVDLIERRRDATRLLVVQADEQEVSRRLQELIDRIWSGMRPYRYDAAAIGRAITALARLEMSFRCFDLGAGHGTMLVAKRVLTDPIEVEFGIVGGGSSRACVSGGRLLGALSDVARHALQLPNDATGAMVLDRLAPFWGKTLRCFDQDRLMDLFIDEIIPWQVVSKRDPIAFSSLHITSLGRP